jgi:hypothetical protein
MSAKNMMTPEPLLDSLTLKAGDFEPLAVSMPKGAGMIGVSKRSLENYAALGLIETRKLGRRRVVLVSSLRKFLRADRPSVSRARDKEMLMRQTGTANRGVQQ